MRPMRFSWVAALALVVVGCGGAGDSDAPARGASEAPVPVKEDAHGAVLGQLQPHWTAAAQPDRALLTEMVSAGAVVFSLRPAAEDPFPEEAYVRSLGGRFLRLPMPHGGELDVQLRTRFYELADSLTRTRVPVLLHCHSGNRVGALWSLYLVEHRHMPAQDAILRGRRLGMTSEEKYVREVLSGLPDVHLELVPPIDPDADLGC